MWDEGAPALSSGPLSFTMLSFPYLKCFLFQTDLYQIVLVLLHQRLVLLLQLLVQLLNLLLFFTHLLFLLLLLYFLYLHYYHLPMPLQTSFIFFTPHTYIIHIFLIEFPTHNKSSTSSYLFFFPLFSCGKNCIGLES